MRSVMDYGWKDWLRISAGIVMLLLGIAGLVLPVLQGVLFLLVSATLLAPYSRSVRRLLAWSRQRFPAAYRQARRMRARIRLSMRRNR